MTTLLRSALGALALAALPAAAEPAFATAPLDPGIVSTAASEYNYSESRDGSLRIFARAPKGFEHAQVYVSRREGGRWSAPAPIDFSDPRFTDSDPFLAADGRTLYFVSNRPLDASGQAKKELDIWRSRLADGKWAAPEHVDGVSSDKMELGVELHGDTLYFNSSRAGGPAGLSIYSAKVQGNGFGHPVALPGALNGGSLQGDFTISPDGKVALFWSRRDGVLSLYAAAREGDGWGVPVRLGPPVVPPQGFTFTPAFSADGETLWFASNWKPEGADAAGVLNGEANIYRVDAKLVREALAARR